MKVAIDARMINSSGIGTYIKNLMKGNLYDIVLGDNLDLKNYNQYYSECIKFTSPIYGIKEQLKFPYKELKKCKPDILHVPHYNIPLFYSGNLVVTIHDLTHLVYKEFLNNKLEYYYAKFMIYMAIKKSKTVITVSESTKKDILKFYPKTNPKKIKVIYNGVSDEFIEKDKSEVEYLYKKYSIPRGKKILLYVGNLKPHKNLEIVLQALTNIKDKEKYCLVLVGKAFNNQIDLKDREKKLKIDEMVIHTGLVNQTELIDFYNLADLFIFPSLYEGFGLPILESLKCGTPVASSNVSSMPEVGLDMIEYFDPTKVEELKKIIEKEEYILVKKKIRFNWNDAINQTKQIFI